jgi:hypothetical protein
MGTIVAILYSSLGAQGGSHGAQNGCGFVSGSRRFVVSHGIGSDVGCGYFTTTDGAVSECWVVLDWHAVDRDCSVIFGFKSGLLFGLEHLVDESTLDSLVFASCLVQLFFAWLFVFLVGLGRVAPIGAM